MKKAIFSGFSLLLTLFVVSAANARQHASLQAQYNYIMNNPWNNKVADYVMNSWFRYSDTQKRAILERMYEQGLLGRSEVDIWPMDQAPQPYFLKKK